MSIDGARTHVKICGLRRAEDARLAAALGASALGFVFWPDSPRFVDPYRVRPFLRDLSPFVTTVGVFVDQPLEYVLGVAGLLNLGAIQLHGRETLGTYARCAFRVIKAVPVDDRFDPGTLEAVPPNVTVLLDAHDPVRRGGTGRTIDWARAESAARQRPVILSGGLTPGNVAAAVAAVRPYAIDVSSGVESSPGVKDPGKLRALFTVLTQINAGG
jgi:phosphoribosylanthranilate isomerase